MGSLTRIRRFSTKTGVGNLWIGTREAGLFRYDSANLSFERITEHQEILSIKEDRDGNMWIGTRGGGLTQFKPQPWI